MFNGFNLSLYIVCINNTFHSQMWSAKKNRRKNTLMDTTQIILMVVVSLVVGAVCFGIAFVMGKKSGHTIGYNERKTIAEAEIGSAEEKSKRIAEDAERDYKQKIKEADSKKKEALIEAKEEIHKLRQDADREIKERRSELNKQEKRLLQKEETIDKKTANIERKDEDLNRKHKVANATLEEAEKIKNSQISKLEAISQLTAEQAKVQLIESLDSELIHEKAMKIKSYEQKLNEESEDMAKDLISLAISRVASEHVSDATVSVVQLPNDEMKGRIIGREGRNIKAIETLTGVDLIIDDTPEAITVSCFDQVRRETARLSLERLIQDGRIHPTRIEEIVEKTKREIDAKIKAEGERAVLETNVHGIHPEIVKLIGRLRYRSSYGQNVLNHSIEVAHLAGIMANELGLDAVKARRAGLLHDIGKGLTHEIEGSHVDIGVDVCQKFKEDPEIIHAIEAHHGDVEIKTPLAAIIQACDAVSAARPGARKENIENYIKRLQKLEEIACSFTGVEKSYAIQAGREIRIIVKPDEIPDDKITIVARDIAKQIEADLTYPGQIKVNIIRESRAIEYAK